MFTTLARSYLFLLTFYLLLRLTVGDGFWGVSLLNTFAPFWFVPLPLALLFLGWKRLWPSFALASGLSLVAIFWFGPAFLPKPVPVAVGPTLTVVNFNMRASPEGLEPWLRDFNPTSSYCKKFRKPIPRKPPKRFKTSIRFSKARRSCTRATWSCRAIPLSRAPN